MKIIQFYILLFFVLPITISAKVNFSETTPLNNSDTIVYQIDIKESRVNWYCDIHNGYVSLDSGYIVISNNEIIDGRFVICMESIVDLDIDDYELMRITLENTLKSVEFFNTPKFHHSAFEFDYVEQSEKGYFITGELELMGVTQCIDFDSEFEVDGNKLIATSDSITIDRTHWGVTSMSEDDAKSNKSFIVPNDIGIIVNLVAYGK